MFSRIDDGVWVIFGKKFYDPNGLLDTALDGFFIDDIIEFKSFRRFRYFGKRYIISVEHRVLGIISFSTTRITFKI